MRLALHTSVALVLSLASCEKSSNPIPNDSSQLEGTWLNAHEEDRADVRVYRPDTYAFGPSRGRTGFTFEPNGQFTQYDIAPTDGLISRSGRWELAGNDIRISLDNQQLASYTLEVVSLENQVLKVKRK